MPRSQSIPFFGYMILASFVLVATGFLTAPLNALARMVIGIVFGIPILLLIAVVGFLAVSGVGFAVENIMGRSPSVSELQVRCPVKQVPARIVIQQAGNDFGNRPIKAVLACSLFPEGKLACHKECLLQL